MLKVEPIGQRTAAGNGRNQRGHIVSPPSGRYLLILSLLRAVVTVMTRLSVRPSVCLLHSSAGLKLSNLSYNYYM